MKKRQMVLVLVGAVCLSGCIATVSPGGHITASYILPSVIMVDDGPNHHYKKSHHLKRPPMVYAKPRIHQAKPRAAKPPQSKPHKR